MANATKSSSGPVPGTIAYAPRLPQANLPWVFEVDAVTRRVAAMIPSDDEGPINARRDRSRRRAHESLATACEAYGLIASRDLELRWWDHVDLGRIVELELERLGVRDATTRRAADGVWIVRGGVERYVGGAFDLYAWERAGIESIAVAGPAVTNASPAGETAP